MSVFIEIRSGEGGDDAKLLVKDQFGIYLKMGSKRGL
jgi:protein subunit release factor A